MQNRCRKRWVNLMISSIFVSFCGHTKTHFGSSQPWVCFFHHQSLKSPSDLPYHRTPAEGPTWPCGLPCSSAASAASSTLQCCTFYSVFPVSKEGTEEGAKRRKHRGRAYTVLVLNMYFISKCMFFSVFTSFHFLTHFRSYVGTLNVLFVMNMFIAVTAWSFVTYVSTLDCVSFLSMYNKNLDSFCTHFVSRHSQKTRHHWEMRQLTYRIHSNLIARLFSRWWRCFWGTDNPWNRIVCNESHRGRRAPKLQSLMNRNQRMETDTLQTRTDTEHIHWTPCSHLFDFLVVFIAFLRFLLLRCCFLWCPLQDVEGKTVYALLFVQHTIHTSLRNQTVK